MDDLSWDQLEPGTMYYFSGNPNEVRLCVKLHSGENALLILRGNVPWKVLTKDNPNFKENWRNYKYTYIGKVNLSA